MYVLYQLDAFIRGHEYVWMNVENLTESPYRLSMYQIGNQDTLRFRDIQVQVK